MNGKDLVMDDYKFILIIMFMFFMSSIVNNYLDKQVEISYIKQGYVKEKSKDNKNKTVWVKRDGNFTIISEK